jgi:peptide/nickel transport system permease protein
MPASDTTMDAADALPKPRATPFWRTPTFRRLVRHRSFMIGLAMFSFVVALAVLAWWIAPNDPNRTAIRMRFRPPQLDRVLLLGTDNLGRNMLSRIVHGAQLSLLIGLGVVVLNSVFGVLLGAVAGYFRKLDGPMMRLADALMAFPSILLAIGIAAALGPSAWTAVIALSVVYIPRTARIVRASVLVVREMEFVQAARASGAGHWRIISRHIMPNCMAPLIVQLSFIFAYAVLSEAVLSFLGLGAPPSIPSWGTMISEGRTYIREASWLTIVPGCAIALTVLGLNLMGDGLRDVLDPRLKIEQG